MPEQMICTVAEFTRLNPYAYSMALAAPKPWKGVSVGQFVHIKCGHSRLLRRPISICDWQEEILRVVFEVRGDGTQWLARREVGDKLDVLGPLGHGFTLGGGKLLLVGGGIGVPPLLACAKQAAGMADGILGFRSADRAMLVEEFSQVCGHLDLCSDDGTLGEHCFVDALVGRQLEEGGYAAVLACGPKPMLRAVYRAAADRGVPCQVSMEERMGCGVGACLVCAVPMADGSMKHACKDGPVFLGEEVAWDD